jgi:hypothetical protein
MDANTVAAAGRTGRQTAPESILVTVGTDGTVQSSDSIPVTDPSLIDSSASVAGGGLVLGVLSFPSDMSADVASLVRITADGEQTWTAELDVEGTPTEAAVVEVRPGLYGLSVTTTGTTTSTTTVAAVTNGGDIQWRRTYERQYDGEALLSDGEAMYLVGSRRRASDGQSGFVATMSAETGDGQITRFDGPTAAATSTDDGVLVAGTATDDAASARVSKLNPDWSVAWSRTYPTDLERFDTAEIVSASAGEYVVVGSGRTRDGPQAASTLIHVDETGEVIEQYDVSNRDVSYVASTVTPLECDEFLVAGYVNSESGGDVGWVALLDGTASRTRSRTTSDAPSTETNRELDNRGIGAIAGIGGVVCSALVARRWLRND